MVMLGSPMVFGQIDDERRRITMMTPKATRDLLIQYFSMRFGLFIEFGARFDPGKDGRIEQMRCLCTA